MTLDTAAFLYGPTLHHLDHLAPLSQELKIPLFVTDEEIAEAVKKYYPAVDLREVSRLEAATYLCNEYSSMISCLPPSEIEQLFFFAETLTRKKITTIWCPHGQSDKGHISGFLKGLTGARSLLLYGPKMVDLLSSLGVLKTIRGYALLGNYRLADYHKHRVFYDKKVKEALRTLEPAERTYLYAPTWEDTEKSSSFMSAYHLLIDHLPPNINLIIRPHPNLVTQHPNFFVKIRYELEEHPHILLLEELPLVYPLLACVDLYIGDLSSMGYDFLNFNKPMIFLNEQERDPSLDAGVSLFKCGIHLTPNEYSDIYHRIENLLPYDKEIFSEVRKELYTYAFGKAEDLMPLGGQIRELLPKIIYENF